MSDPAHCTVMVMLRKRSRSSVAAVLGGLALVVEATEFLTEPFGWLSENMHPLPENAVPGS